MRPVLLTLRIGERVVGIHTYGVLIAAGFAAGIAVAFRQARRQGLDGGRVLDLAFWILIAGLLGSRALYALVHADTFVHACLGSGSESRTAARVAWDCTRVLHVWEGGLVFYGGLLAAAAVLVAFARREGWNPWTIGDVLAPGLALGHAIGRLGCFAAGCCFGKACPASGGPLCVSFPRDSAAFDDLAALDAVPLGADRTPPLYPTQLLEAAGELLIFAVLLWLRRRLGRPQAAGDQPNPRSGTLVLVYAGLYAILRFVVELFRGDEGRTFVARLATPRLAAALHLPLREPVLLSSGQLLSIAVLVGVLVLDWRRRAAG